jgi:hypothetical protein
MSVAGAATPSTAWWPDVHPIGRCGLRGTYVSVAFGEADLQNVGPFSPMITNPESLPQTGSGYPTLPH